MAALKKEKSIPMTDKPQLCLAGDLGGTKTNLAIVSAADGPRRPLVEATFASGAYPDLTSLVAEFLAQVHLPVRHACFGVAGPVVNGCATITNLPWQMDEAELARHWGMTRVVLLNDLVAGANAVPQLTAADLHTLHAGAPTPNGALAVIAPGTGLGEAFLVHDGDRYRAYPSEGGHADFAANNDFEDGLLRYLRAALGHVSWERVCSGLGIPNIYEYLKVIDFAEEPAWLTAALAAATDPTPVIVNAALQDETPCLLCRATLNTFVSILGAEAGNLALKVLATGGVYIGGGIPPRILPLLQEEGFMQAFLNKGRFTALLQQIPVHVIRNPKAALLGAACYGLAIEAV